MPNLPNAKKALRQSKKRTTLNRQYKNRVKRIARSIDDAVKSGNSKEAANVLPAYFKAIDKAVKKNILHRNTAARRKSLYSRKVSEKPPVQHVQKTDKSAKSEQNQN